MGAAVTERGSREIGALEVVRALRAADVRNESDTDERSTPRRWLMVWGVGLGFLVELIADIIEQSGFIDVEQSRRRMLQAPACEVQEIIGIGAQGTEGKLANALRIEEVIGPGDFLPLVIDQAIGRSAGGGGRLMEQREFHNDCASSRQARKSAAVAPAAK